MPVFTAAATFIAAALSITSATFISATAFALEVAAGLGLSYIAAAIKGKPKQDAVGIEGKLSVGGDIPRSFIMGRYNTAGSLVYRGTWGDLGDTPNAIYDEVRALSDLPIKGLVDVWVDGQQVTLVNGVAQEYIKDGAPHLNIAFYDGTQTAADPGLVTNFGSTDRPYGSDRVGTGVAYAIVNPSLDDKSKDNPLFTGFPQCKFTVDGIALYDPSKDSTVGGDGSQRWDDRSTWGGDGDDLPAVQVYNILRGITYNGAWVFGLQNPNPAILPAANWIAAINKCRTVVDGPDGPEPQYRSAAQVSCDTAIADVIEALLAACAGRLTENGGVYTIHVGEPDSPVYSFTDDEVLSSEEQTFNPFRTLSDSINGVVATYPEPLEGWNVKTAPPFYNPDQEVRDGNRRLMSSVDLTAVPYHGQVQRLIKSAILEALRERRHTIVLGPWAQCLEPGDIVQWSSVRNGYEDKLFRIDGMAYKANLDVMLQLTEVDPSDYDWHQDTDYKPPYFAPLQVIRPPSQPIVAWYAEGRIVNDSDGLPRRPVIFLSWDGTKKDIQGVAYEISTDGTDAGVILRDSTDDASAGSIIVGSQAFIPGETYYARGRYIPSAPRDTPFSAWLPAILPDIKYGLLDFDAQVRDMFDHLIQAVDAKLQPAIDLFNTVVADLDAQTFLDKYKVKDETAKIRVATDAKIDEVTTTVGDVSANVTTVQTAVTSLQGNFASYQTTVTAQFDAANSSITQNATAISTVDASLSSLTSTVSSNYNTLNSAVTSNATALSTTNQTVAQLTNTVTANYGDLSSKVTTNATAITGVNSTLGTLSDTVSSNYGSLSSSVTTLSQTVATNQGQVASQYTLTLNANNYVAGFKSINTGTFSAITFQFDAFRIAVGAAATTVFQVATVNGVTALALRGDMVIDGGITARMLSVGSITALNGAIDHLAVQTLNLADQAVTVPAVAVGGTAGGNGSFNNIVTLSFNVDTTGLAGKTIAVVVTFSGQQGTGGANTWGVALSSSGNVFAGIFGGSTFQPSFSCSGLFLFTASGGSQLVSLEGQWSGGAGMQVNNSLLTATVSKR